jgi:hypothetical protein
MRTVSEKKKKIERIVTFDILRGYFLVGIIIDHLSFFPNGLDWWSMRGGLFVTMAEGFFLISGIILGIIRGAKMVDVPFHEVVKLLLKRGFQLYIVAVILAILFTVVGWLFYMNAPGLKSGIAPANTPLWQLIWNAATFQYLYGWADYLRLYAVFLFASPLIMWLLRRGLWYVGLGLSLLVWLLFPDSNVADGGLQEKMQIVSWQLIFFIGMTIGFYWPTILAKWRSLSLKARHVIGGSVVAFAAVTLAYNVAIMLSTMGFNMSAIGATPQLQHDLYVAFFDKERLPLTRIALFLLWFGAAFYLVRRFEQYILKFLGWLLLPFGHNSLYVYTVHAFMIFFVHLYLSVGSIPWNFVVSVTIIMIIWLMIRYKVLMKIIPR